MCEAEDVVVECWLLLRWKLYKTCRKFSILRFHPKHYFRSRPTFTRQKPFFIRFEYSFRYITNSASFLLAWSELLPKYYASYSSTTFLSGRIIFLKFFLSKMSCWHLSDTGFIISLQQNIFLLNCNDQKRLFPVSRDN